MNYQKIDTLEICRMIREAPKELLSSTETCLLLTMAIIGGKNNRKINPGLKWLAEYTKLSKSSLIRLIEFLVSKEVLIITHDRKRGSHENSCYEINVDLLSNARSNRSHRNKTNPEKLISSCEIKNEQNIFSLSSSTVTPESSVTMTPRTIQPIITTINDQSIVKSEADPILPISKKFEKKIRKENSLLADAHIVFDYWKEVMEHPGARFDEQRKRKIISALNNKFSVEQLKKAIDNAKKSDFHRGCNDSGTIYDSIGLIFRNPEKIGEFIRGFGTNTAGRNKNVATAPKMSFTERNKKRVNMFSDLESIMFPEFANRPMLARNKDGLLTYDKKDETNGW